MIKKFLNIIIKEFLIIIIKNAKLILKKINILGGVVGFSKPKTSKFN